MDKCPTCQTKTQKNWNYCPQCGIRIVEKQLFPVAKISYTWEKTDGGAFIHKNFKAVRESGVFLFKQGVPIRQTLGDFSHIQFYNLRKFSLLAYNPKLIYELYEAYKLMGYYDTETVIKEAELQGLLDSLVRTDYFWSIYEDKKFIQPAKEVFLRLGVGILDWTLHKQKGRVNYRLRESISTPIKASHTCCAEQVGDFIGALESLSYRFWNGREVKCKSKGDDYCEFDMYLTKSEEKPEIEVLDKKEVDGIVDKIIEDIVAERTIKYRKKVGDYVHIGGDQCINYILTARSMGHEILAKYSGSIVGQKISQELGLKTTEESLEHLTRIFNKLRVGIIKEPQYSQDKIKLQMFESMYSSGVENIQKKLDTFIAGIIEGTIKQATGEKWTVEETKCLANGDKYCEFKCELR